MIAALAALLGLWLGWWIARTPDQPEPVVDDWTQHVHSALWVARRSR